MLPGVLWLRLKLPFRLNHVNVYLIADGDGWALFDTGFGNEATIAAWTTLLEGELSGVQLSRVIVSHAHPDHLGLAGWLVARFQCPLQMSQLEFLHGVYHQHRRTEERVENSAVLPPSWHGRSHDPATARSRPGLSEKDGADAGGLSAPQPWRPPDDRRARIQVMTGAGHSPDQVMLYCAADNFLLSADQVLSKISPNVSVWAQEPDEDALGAYLHSPAHDRGRGAG
ncbi:MAG: MBL fold metallo-hydrolase [Rhodopseudomonas palustris]|nr:MBL fold metallo-hydrolase [Rhodopseudomonas palustris]